MTLVQVADMKVDEATGEILEWPTSAATEEERLDILLSRIREAQRQEKDWADYARFLKSAALSLFAALDVERYTGTDGWCRIGVTESVDREALPVLQGEAELSQEAMNAILLGSLQTLNVSRFRDMALAAGVDLESIERVVRKTRWLDVRGVRKQAPERKEIND